MSIFRFDSIIPRTSLNVYILSIAIYRIFPASYFPFPFPSKLEAAVGAVAPRVAPSFLYCSPPAQYYNCTLLDKIPLPIPAFVCEPLLSFYFIIQDSFR